MTDERFDRYEVDVPAVFSDFANSRAISDRLTKGPAVGMMIVHKADGTIALQFCAEQNAQAVIRDAVAEILGNEFEKTGVRINVLKPVADKRISGQAYEPYTVNRGLDKTGRGEFAC